MVYKQLVNDVNPFTLLLAEALTLEVYFGVSGNLFWFVVHSYLQKLEQDKIQDLPHEIYIKQSRVTLNTSQMT